MKLFGLENTGECTILGYRNPQWPIKGVEKMVVHIRTGIMQERYFLTDDGRRYELPVNKLKEMGGFVRRSLRGVVKSRRG